jgi:MoaA/NifB/PqqE/SkfB family radical SAM enzyme
MRSPKVRDTLDTDIVGMAHQSLPIRYWSPETHETVDLVKEPTITYSKDHEEFKVVVWELGRRCNYNCWYCGPSAHNNYENQKALQTMIDGYEQLARIWLCNQPTKFVFAGGESTFNPDFMQFAQYITSRGLGHVLHVTTNGSHTNQYYTELAKISSISFSAHLTYLETPNIYNKFVKNIELATINRGLNYIEVRIMLEPGKLAFAQQLYQDLKAVTNNVTVDLLHDQDLNIMEYSPEEQTWAASIH